MPFSFVALNAEVTTGGAAGLESIGELFTQFTTWMGNIVTTMTSDGNELMLIPVGFFVAGGVIGLASRLIGR